MKLAMNIKRNQAIIGQQFLAVIFMSAVFSNVAAQTIKDIEANRITLPNGWSLTPAGKTLPLGDLPLNIALSPSGKIAAITNNGQSDQTIQLLDIEKEIILDSVIIGKSWLGLAFSGDGRSLYASGGNDNIIIKYSILNNHLSPADTIVIGKAWPEEISIAGLALDDSKNRIYAVTKENNSLYVADTKSGKVISKFDLGGEGYTCILSPDHKILYISCWGCDKIVVFDTQKQAVTSAINVGDNPNDICITKDGKYLFAANANDNSVSVIDTRQLKVIEILNSALYPDSPPGSTPNSVALSEDERTLYIANADNNCLSVFDVSKPGFSISKGFIPTGWYPACVRVAGNKILVANGKGMSSRANPYGPNPYMKHDDVVYQAGGSNKKMKVQYIGGLFKGTLSIIQTPDINLMSLYSQAVYKNTPYSKNKELTSEVAKGNPIPVKVGDKSPIKYIFYVIKENRTYDQVLGDMSQGNGDPGLVLFGENITPNQHALASEFVLLDNFFVDGEVSADGHNWTMGAYATDFLEKNWPTSYGSRGGKYNGEGERAIANNKTFLWDNCRRNNVSYRTYGEFIGDGGPKLPVLKDHYCKYYSPWVPSVRDTIRFAQWKRDFDSLLAANALPQLNTLHIINDHTEGLSLGVGMLIDYISHSPVWQQSLILIVEDDAQNGPDHVDAHRSPAYIAGGYVKKGFVDHTAYTTSSLLRTIELILGLPPMTQYDASAVPLWRCMNNTADHPPFVKKPCLVDLNEKNTAENIWQQKSEKFDFSAQDRVNDSDFNEVLWKAVKGLDAPCPPSVRAAFFMSVNGEDND
jgi:YVTN family beta-propeller protein